MNPNPITRNYNGSDALMAQAARVTQSLVEEDLALFNAFDSTITAEYNDDFLMAIIAAEVVVADTSIVDQQVQKTELIQVAMEKAKSKYNDIKYFAQKTFPQSPGTQNEFGLNDYERARKNSEQMIEFLEEMSKAAVKYQRELVAKGLAQDAIAEIQTIRTELLGANTNQEVFKKQRPKLTEDRIITLNACYDIMVLLNAAAQRVYKDDFAKQNQFVFNPSAAVSAEEYAGVVAKNTTVTIATVPYDENNIFSFKNTGTTPLVFCLSTTSALEGIQTPLGGGATLNLASAELNPDATKLLVQNTSTTQDGAYEVLVDN